MVLEEQRAWVYGGVSALTYLGYLVVVLTTGVGWVRAALVAIAVSVLVTVVLDITVSVRARRRDDGEVLTDLRDTEIARAGERVGTAFVVLAGIAAFALAALGVDQLWIGNALYLGFTLSAVVGSAARLAAYREGFVGW